MEKLSRTQKLGDLRNNIYEYNPQEGGVENTAEENPPLPPSSQGQAQVAQPILPTNQVNQPLSGPQPYINQPVNPFGPTSVAQPVQVAQPLQPIQPVQPVQPVQNPYAQQNPLPQQVINPVDYNNPIPTQNPQMGVQNPVLPNQNPLMANQPLQPTAAYEQPLTNFTQVQPATPVQPVNPVQPRSPYTKEVLDNQGLNYNQNIQNPQPFTGFGNENPEQNPAFNQNMMNVQNQPMVNTQPNVTNQAVQSMPNYGPSIPQNFGQATSSFAHTESIPINPSQQTEVFSEKTDAFFDNLLKEAKQYSIEHGLRTEEDTHSNVIDAMVNSGVVPPSGGGYQPPSNPIPETQLAQTQPINTIPPYQPVAPNPYSTQAADLAFEQQVQAEAKQVYSEANTGEMLIEQIRSIENATAPEAAPQVMAAQPLPQPTIPPVDTTITGKVAFETGKMDAINDQITTVEANEYSGDLDIALSAKIASETDALQERITNYEEELDEVSSNAGYTNRLLNIILIFLILGLTIVLGIVIYWILNVRGII